MSRRVDTRREFLKTATVVGGSALLGARATRGADKGPGGRLHLACNEYPWMVFYARENRDFGASLDSGLAEVAQTGVDGFEPLVTGPPQIDQLAPLLKKHGLQMRSLYVNSTLHSPDQAEESIEQVLAIAEKAKRLGAKIIVTNPNPIRWGGPEDKNDAQLQFQARALNKLGARLKEMGLLLAYHNHDAELRNAAREFHHMMLGTNPEYVTLCLDAHWIYRGAGNSAVALFDVLKLYGRRVSELHLRQSVNHVWTEALGDGDIDYPRLARQLLKIGVKPHLVIEQAVEQGSPKTMDAVESHRRSCAYARRVFAGFAG
jgi:inosose dehydratase